MRCPSCGDEANRVIDTRDSRDAIEIRRRRECDECGHRFTTRERVEQVLPKVIKRDERREDYDRAKLALSIERSCVKRPISIDAIESLADSIERSLLESGEREVSSRTLGEQVMAALTALDLLAAVRFASVFLNFQSTEDYAAFFEATRSRAADAAPPPVEPEAERSTGSSERDPAARLRNAGS